jgi:hypothetical protein|tara:strand:+ start:4123 stop:4482 length:360 start_codon:yes stop_codon:yes gene_type:complete
MYNEKKILRDKENILKSLNENHPKYGYSKHDLIDILVKSCGYECNLVFINSILDTERSMINTIGSLDELCMFLTTRGILDVRSTILKDNFLRLRYFTMNYDNFEKNKLRKKKINKILDK